MAKNVRKTFVKTEQVLNKYYPFEKIQDDKCLKKGEITIDWND